MEVVPAAVVRIDLEQMGKEPDPSGVRDVSLPIFDHFFEVRHFRLVFGGVEGCGAAPSNETFSILTRPALTFSRHERPHQSSGSVANLAQHHVDEGVDKHWPHCKGHRTIVTSIPPHTRQIVLVRFPCKCCLVT
jgi:hypothetical protein